MEASSAPVWDFEAFRQYLPYERMQPAANVLSLFDGCPISDRNMMRLLTSELHRRTGLSWMPERSSGPLDYSEEGTLFRNKARLLASLFVCVSPEIQRLAGRSETVQLLSFGRALASGKVARQQYYDFIITRFRYPHPVFTSYEDWVKRGVVCHPFRLLLLVLLRLHSIKPEYAWLEKTEVVSGIMPVSDDAAAEALGDTIAAAREVGSQLEDVAYPAIAQRKVNDMMAFLAMSGYALLSPDDRLHLNLVGRHSTELTYYLQERRSRKLRESRIETILNLAN